MYGSEMHGSEIHGSEMLGVRSYLLLANVLQLENSTFNTNVM